MSTLRPLGHLSAACRGSGSQLSINARSQWQSWRRSFASVGKAPEVDKLPLSGLRVLDMTRVLAGVGGNPKRRCSKLVTDWTFDTALLHADIR
jgi:hypothetical protein